MWKVSVAFGSKTVGEGLTVRTVWMNKKDINTDHWLAQHCTLDKTDQKHNMQRRKQRDSCLVPHVVDSLSFPYQEMPSGIRAVTGANWTGELEGLRSTSCGLIYFGDHLLETYSSTQPIVALSTEESEYISISKGAAHALEVRSAMVEYGMTFKMCVKRTRRLDGQWPRDVV